MSFQLKIQPEVKLDIQDGLNWYREKQEGLDLKFLSEIEQTFSSLKVNPFYQVRYDKVRCVPLRTFPFMIHFSIDEEKELIIIQAIFHTRRNPSHWDKRNQ